MVIDNSIGRLIKDEVLETLRNPICSVVDDNTNHDVYDLIYITLFDNINNITDEWL